MVTEPEQDVVFGGNSTPSALAAPGYPTLSSSAHMLTIEVDKEASGSGRLAVADIVVIGPEMRLGGVLVEALSS